MKPKEKQKKKQKFSQALPVFYPNAAGIDVGDTEHDVAIFDSDKGYIAKKFQTFTEDLIQLVDWLKSSGVTTVAMESTGVYWVNLYLMLEEAGIEPFLVNAKHVKNVTGRKKDDTDAMWIQKLHSCGLLQKSFQPEGSIRKLRNYVRHRKNLIMLGSNSVRRMQKALELMNIKLHTVISDILGKTGLQMVNAIIDGERDPDELLKYKDPRIKASDEDIRKSLKGIWKDEFLFMLRQAYEEYSFYQKQIQECDHQIHALLLAQVAKVLDGDISGFEQVKKKAQKNQFNFNARAMLKEIVGVDLCKIDGISEVNAVELISEIGLNMNNWKSSKHFAAWLNLVPNTKITGGKIISNKMNKKKNHAGQTLRMAASTLTNSKAPIGNYARKMRARLGKKGGVVATAHKLSRIIYTMIKTKQAYNPNAIEINQEKWKIAKIKQLERQIKYLKGVA
jgi:transposase